MFEGRDKMLGNGCVTRRKVIGGIAALVGAQMCPAEVKKGAQAARQTVFNGGAKGWVNPYVTDGLLAMWDGIENAGWGTHDNEATVWIDLSGNGHDLTLRNGAYFDTNSLVTANRNMLTALISDNILLPYATVEVCAYFDASRNSSMMVCMGNSVDNQRLMVCGPTGIQVYNGMNYMTFTTQVNAKSVWSGTHEGNEHKAYVNGSEAIGTKSNNNWTSREGGFGLSGTSNYASYNFVGNYYCVRLYNRALTAKEIEHNYAVDKIRFGLP